MANETDLMTQFITSLSENAYVTYGKDIEINRTYQLFTRESDIIHNDGYTIKLNNPLFIDLLIKYGAKIDTYSIGEAARYGDINCIKTFIKCGEKPYKEDLLIAVKNNHIECVNFLSSQTLSEEKKPIYRPIW